MLMLASNSPRRRQLLSLAGWSFSTSVSNIDETRLPGETPGEYVLRLAEEKARAVRPGAGAESIIIGADTAVVDGSEILGKPADGDEARRFLGQLRGRTHQVFTGVAALRLHDEELLADLCVTDVPMRDYSEAEIDAYVRTGDPLDKAGAYGIQHPVFRPVREMRGCYPSVMGLPLCRLVRLLHQLGLPPVNDITSGCHEHLDVPCPVYLAIQSAEGPGPFKGEE
jgi:MAF protein